MQRKLDKSYRIFSRYRETTWIIIIISDGNIENTRNLAKSYVNNVNGETEKKNKLRHSPYVALNYTIFLTSCTDYMTCIAYTRFRSEEWKCLRLSAMYEETLFPKI